MGLNWESTYELALALRHTHGDVDLESVTLDQLFEWIVALPVRPVALIEVTSCTCSSDCRKAAH